MSGEISRRGFFGVAAVAPIAGVAVAQDIAAKGALLGGGVENGGLNSAEGPSPPSAAPHQPTVYDKIRSAKQQLGYRNNEADPIISSMRSWSAATKARVHGELLEAERLTSWGANRIYAPGRIRMDHAYCKHLPVIEIDALRAPSLAMKTHWAAVEIIRRRDEEISLMHKAQQSLDRLAQSAGVRVG